MATGSFVTQNYSRSQSEVPRDLHKFSEFPKLFRKLISRTGNFVSCSSKRSKRAWASKYNYKNLKLISYPDNIPSAIYLVPHGPNIPMPLPPTELQKNYW
ncbi:hypothetical protein TNCV_2545211 [Trichonephila clavipes]|nr:hypothetical protein TNCV_2545211 [Trichonephila clavipes]